MAEERQQDWYQSRNALPSGSSRGGIHKRTIVILGFRGVGKSAVTGRFVDDTFNEQYNPTIEAHFTTRLKTSRGQDTTVEVFDLAGMDQTNEIRQQLILSAHGYILMYAIKYPNSLQMIENINDRLLVQCGDDAVPRVLVANMSDLKDLSDSRQVSTEDGENMAKHLGVEFFETSAKTGEGIRSAFMHLLDEIDNKLHMPTELPAEEIECHASLCDMEGCCCMAGDDESPSPNCVFAAVAAQLALGIMSLVLVFSAPMCSSDDDHNLWQNYYLLFQGIVTMFASVLLLVAIQKEKRKMVQILFGFMALTALANAVIGVVSLLTQAHEHCSTRMSTIGWGLIGSTLINFFSLLVLYRSHSQSEVTPNNSISTAPRRPLTHPGFSNSILGHSYTDPEFGRQSGPQLGHSHSFFRSSATSEALLGSAASRAEFGRAGAVPGLVKKPPSEQLESYGRRLPNA